MVDTIKPEDLPTQSNIIRQDLDLIFKTTSTKLVAAINEMVTQGKTVEMVKQTLKDAGTFSPARALTIARTTAGTAMSLEQLKSGIAIGAENKTWHDSGFEVRPAHHKRNGETVPILQRFSPIKAGATGPAFPGDPIIPVEDRINCRCFLTFSQ